MGRTIIQQKKPRFHLANYIIRFKKRTARKQNLNNCLMLTNKELNRCCKRKWCK